MDKSIINRNPWKIKYFEQLFWEVEVRIFGVEALNFLHEIYLNSQKSLKEQSTNLSRTFKYKNSKENCL